MSGQINKPVSKLRAEVARKKPITPAESTKLLLEGNKLFMHQVQEEKVSLHGLARGPLREVILACSDARLSLVFDVHLLSQHRTAVIFTAGNVFYFPSTDKVAVASRKMYDDLALQLKDPRLIKVIGHINCGAVAHRKDKDNPEIPADIRELLGQVQGDELDNTSAQFFLLREKLPRIVSSFAPHAWIIFDWTNEEDPLRRESNPLIRINDKTTQSIYELLSLRMEQGLFTGLDTQYAHAVAVTSVNGPELQIPFTLREVFGVERPNEVFCVTANGNLNGAAGFDPISRGSILYSLLNNQTSNIVLVHRDKMVLTAWKRELTSWLTNLTRSENALEHSVGERFVKGEIGITCMTFNFNEGRVALME